MASNQSSPVGSSTPRSMTKEMLRNALIQHGVPVPDKSALKEEFVRLYQEHVVPTTSRQGEFSSDDEQDGSARSDDGLKLNFEAGEIEPYVKELSDVELYGYLKYFDISCGPVVASTRALYESQVIRRLSRHASDSSPVTNGRNHSPDASNGRNGFSDSDDDATVETASRASRSSRASGVHSQNSPSRRQVRVSSSRHVSVTNSTSQPTVNSSTGHYVVESEERKTRRSSARNTPNVELPEDGGGRGENMRPIPSPQQVSSLPRYVTTGTSSIASPSAVSRQSRDTTGNISYFRERPGYASTTTSNVLPRKPTVPRDESPNSAKFDEAANPHPWGKYIAIGVFIAIVGIVVVVMNILSTEVDTGSTVNTGDELDEYLDNLDAEKNEALGDYQ